MVWKLTLHISHENAKALPRDWKGLFSCQKGLLVLTAFQSENLIDPCFGNAKRFGDPRNRNVVGVLFMDERVPFRFGWCFARLWRLLKGDILVQ